MDTPIPKTHAQVVANYLANDLSGILKRKGFSFASNPIDASQLSYMLQLMQDGHLDRKDVRLWCMEECDKAKQALEVLDYFMQKAGKMNQGTQ
jgi:Asp-tRNA(Asn)/Glu-tRNA(Gln) amidotransferase B subunit